MSRPRISEEIRERVRLQAQNRCGYCLSRQEYVWGQLEVEHIVPRVREGTDDEENLWLACRPCNLNKGSQTEGVDPQTALSHPLFNPRMQTWSDHFLWNEAGDEIVGLTAIGRATVFALRLNDSRLVAVRRRWIEVGWHPPKI